MLDLERGVNGARRSTKRRKTSVVARRDQASERPATFDNPTGGGNVYSATTLSGHSNAILGNNYGTVNNNYNHAQQAAPDIDETLLDSLLFPRMNARLNNIEIEFPQTCQWLTEHCQFTDWINTKKITKHHGFLWIKGKPGCGKSTIMRFAYRWAQKAWSGQLNISYFFNGRAPGWLEKSSLGLYRSLTYQVLLALPEFRPAFVEKFAYKGVGDTVEEWTATELKGFLQEVLIQPRSTFLNIFVDALDEGEEDDVRELVSYLETLGRLTASNRSHLRICLSSRHYPHIGIKKGVSLILEEQPDHSKDIEQYIDSALPDENDESEMQALQKEIFRKSNGIFLWVVLVLPMLRRVYDKGGSLKIEATRRLLETIPDELDDLFTKILARDEDDIERCVSLSQWVLFATRALSPTELYLAVEYSRMDNDAPVEIPSSNRMDKYILNWSRGLIETTKSVPPVVQFIHETVRTFLLSDKGLLKLRPALVTNVVGLSHVGLKDACVHFLEFARLPDDKIKRKSTDIRNEQISTLTEEQPLIKYATDNLLRHADLAQQAGIAQTIFLQELLSVADGVWHKWLKLHNYFERFSTGEFSSRVTLLYTASKLNLVHLVQCLAVSPGIVNVQGERYGCALGVACWYEHEAVVRLLLQKGADPSLLSEHLQSYKRSAGNIKNLKILKLLFDYGATPAKMLESGLSCAISKGDVQGFQLLLDLVADLEMTIYNTQNTDEIHSLLSLACLKRRVAMAQILLEKDVDVNFRPDGRWAYSPLDAAAFSGDLTILHMILEAGADVNARGGHFGCPLCAAAWNGHAKIVQMLLEAGADSNSQSEGEGTALNIAARTGYDEIVRMLLQAGADVGSLEWEKADVLHVPLFRAAQNGRVQIVELLLDAGAHVGMGEEFLEKAINLATKGTEYLRPGPHTAVIEILQPRLELLRAGERPVPDKYA